jgi:hypothetical protein
VRVDLPGGGWADVRPASDLKVKDKIAVQRVIAWEQQALEEGEERQSSIPVNAGLSDDLQMAMLGRVVLSWSPDGAATGTIPVTPEILGDLDIETYDALCDAITEHMKLIRSRRPNRGTRTASNGSSKGSRSAGTRQA